MARNSKKVERLPSWKLRLTIWHELLKIDMQSKGYVKQDGSNIARFHDDLSTVTGIPDDLKTFSNWVNKLHYPTAGNLDGLFKASPTSAKWLIADTCSEPLHGFFNALDYFLCAFNPEVQPALFKKEDQDVFADRYLIDVGEDWCIPFVYRSDTQEAWENAPVQDVSLSMLQTHGTSAIPLYLCSLASHGLVPKERVYDWYIALLSSTLIIIGLHHRNGIDFDQPKSLYGNEKYIGTNPNLLATIGAFLLWHDSTPIYEFLEASKNDFNEIADCIKLLECLLAGNVSLRDHLDKLKIEYSEINSLLVSELSINEGAKIELLPRVNKNKISSIHPFYGPFEWESEDLIIYHLCSDEPVRVHKETIAPNGNKSMVLLPSRRPVRANDSHYSWGYGGTGVYNMAYTLLYDLFNHRRSKLNIRIPTYPQMELFVFKLLSRLDMFCQYSISSEQIIYCLNHPIQMLPREVNDEVLDRYVSALST